MSAQGRNKNRKKRHYNSQNKKYNKCKGKKHYKKEKNVGCVRKTPKKTSKTLIYDDDTLRTLQNIHKTKSLFVDWIQDNKENVSTKRGN